MKVSLRKNQVKLKKVDDDGDIKHCKKCFHYGNIDKCNYNLDAGICHKLHFVEV